MFFNFHSQQPVQQIQIESTDKEKMQDDDDYDYDYDDADADGEIGEKKQNGKKKLSVQLFVKC